MNSGSGRGAQPASTPFIAKRGALARGSRISALARTLAERTGLNIEVQSSLDERRLHPDVETLVFRVTQEALTNVIRHSEARSARVVLACRGHTLTLRVEDQGRGFDANQMAAPGRVGGGLRGMRDRAELFGGRIELRSAPGEGTVVQLMLALDAADVEDPSSPFSSRS